METKTQQSPPPSKAESLSRLTSKLDDAYKYTQTHDGEPTSIGIHTLLRKVDYRIMPIMFACYTMQFLDKVLINYAAVMGINRDLTLTGDQFSNVATALFIAYLVAEAPNALALQKFPVAKWLAFNVVAWGIACTCTAAASNYRSLLAARIFLGIFEAAVAPCLMLISSQWYTKSEQAPRFSFWYCGLGVGQILGGLASFAFQHIHHSSFEGWRIMFVAVGLITILVGVITWVVLPDTPMDARFLSDAEKLAIINHVSSNQTGIRNPGFKLGQILEMLTDVQIWLLVILTVLISISSGVITTYSSTLIRNFGFTPPISALLGIPSGVVSIASTLLVGFGVRQSSHRWAWIVGCSCTGILGGALMSFLPQSNRAGLLAGIYLVNAIVATLVVIFQWTASNCAGQTKRAVAAALVSGAFSVGNIIGPQTFRAKDAPAYHNAKIIVLATQAAGAAVAVLLAVYYAWANRQKARQQTEHSDGNETLNWTNWTDKENPSFRYVY